MSLRSLAESSRPHAKDGPDDFAVLDLDPDDLGEFKPLQILDRRREHFSSIRHQWNCGESFSKSKKSNGDGNGSTWTTWDNIGVVRWNVVLTSGTCTTRWPIP